eukprot:TRINITY_DN1746_c0_g1_i4.p1 TRINITY_DN1746_c0_g1~~TRINITY_DN1746_c0_g1_i4.p1  ORF type:complete len:817 (+),score=119.17 TRINITY_DN1746_c0_g1_i4:81-2531(+)
MAAVAAAVEGARKVAIVHFGDPSFSPIVASFEDGLKPDVVVDGTKLRSDGPLNKEDTEQIFQIMESVLFTVRKKKSNYDLLSDPLGFVSDVCSDAQVAACAKVSREICEERYARPWSGPNFEIVGAEKKMGFGRISRSPKGHISVVQLDHPTADHLPQFLNHAQSMLKGSDAPSAFIVGFSEEKGKYGLKPFFLFVLAHSKVEELMKNIDAPEPVSHMPINVLVVFETGSFVLQHLGTADENVQDLFSTVCAECTHRGLECKGSVAAFFIEGSKENLLMSMDRKLSDIMDTERPNELRLVVKSALKNHKAVGREPVAVQTPKPFKIYPTQKSVALRLLYRACSIMTGDTDFANAVRTIGERFNDVEFLILTPVFTSLRDQTAQRVVDAGLVVDGCEGSRFSGQTENFNGDCTFVWMYHLKYTEEKKHLDSLVAHVEAHPKTLFVIIPDECHWGIVMDKAHDLLVNNPKLVQSPNVLQLLISATPYNVLTSMSRVPEKRLVKKENGLGLSVGELVTITNRTIEGSGARLSVSVDVVTQDGRELRRLGMQELEQVLSTDEFHVVDWEKEKDSFLPWMQKSMPEHSFSEELYHAADEKQYRSLDDYLATVADADIGKRLLRFDEPFDRACTGQSSANRDAMLLAEYAVSLLFFYHFRCDEHRRLYKGADIRRSLDNVTAEAFARFMMHIEALKAKFECLEGCLARCLKRYLCADAADSDSQPEDPLLSSAQAKLDAVRRRIVEEINVSEGRKDADDYCATEDNGSRRWFNETDISESFVVLIGDPLGSVSANRSRQWGGLQRVQHVRTTASSVNNAKGS